MLNLHGMKLFTLAIACVVAIPIILIIFYVVFHEARSLFNSWSTRRSTVQPKCPACGRKNESRWITSKITGSAGRWHAERWRPDVQKIEFQCWSCGAAWAETPISYRTGNVEPSTWSSPMPVNQEKK